MREPFTLKRGETQDAGAPRRIRRHSQARGALLMRRMRPLGRAQAPAANATDEVRRLAIEGRRSDPRLANMGEQHPELLGEAAIEELRRSPRARLRPVDRSRPSPPGRGAGEDSRAAWEAFGREREVAAAAGRDLENLQELVDSARAAGELHRALGLIGQTLPVASEIGYGLSVCELLSQRGVVLCQLSTERPPRRSRRC
jgi:hypothetical protein